MNTHVDKNCLETELTDLITLVYSYSELFLKLKQLWFCVQLVQGDVTGTVGCAMFADFLNWLL